MRRFQVIVRVLLAKISITDNLSVLRVKLYVLYFSESPNFLLKILITCNLSVLRIKICVLYFSESLNSSLKVDTANFLCNASNFWSSPWENLKITLDIMQFSLVLSIRLFYESPAYKINTRFCYLKTATNVFLWFNFVDSINQQIQTNKLLNNFLVLQIYN